MSTAFKPLPRIQAARRPRRRFRWLWWTITVLLLLGLLASAAVAIMTGMNLTHPKRKPLTTTPDTYGLTYENVRFNARQDGVHLQGWYLPSAKASDRTVIIAHGYADNRQSSGPDGLAVAKLLVSNGYNALLFDFRDSGESDGTEVTVGWKETRDLEGAVDYVRSRGAGKVALVGYSMGATTSLLTAEALPEVNAVVADSPFESMGPYLLENAGHWTHLPKFPFTYFIYAAVPRMMGMRLDQIDPLDGMASLANRPVLFIHGTADTTIDPHNSQDLLAAYTKDGGTKGSLWLVPGATHTKAFKVAPQEYSQRLLAFLGESLK